MFYAHRAFQDATRAAMSTPTIGTHGQSGLGERSDPNTKHCAADEFFFSGQTLFSALFFDTKVVQNSVTLHYSAFNST